jgi:hypothetical protein
MPIDSCPLCAYPGSGPLCTECGEARLEEYDTKLLRYHISNDPRVIIRLLRSLAVSSWAPIFGGVAMMILLPLSTSTSAVAVIQRAFTTLIVLMSPIAIITCFVVVTWLAHLRSFRNMRGAKCLRVAGVSTIVLIVLYFTSVAVTKSMIIAAPIEILVKATISITLWSGAVLFGSIWKLTRSSRYRNGKRIISREKLSSACKFVALCLMALFVLDLLPGVSSTAGGMRIYRILTSCTWLISLFALPAALTSLAIAVQNELEVSELRKL